jgi:hypothetical protein
MLTIEISRSSEAWNIETRPNRMNVGPWGTGSSTSKTGRIACSKFHPLPKSIGISGTWKPKTMNELSESFLKETYQAMEELDQVSVKKFDSIDELFDALDSD